MSRTHADFLQHVWMREDNAAPEQTSQFYCSTRKGSGFEALPMMSTKLSSKAKE